MAFGDWLSGAWRWLTGRSSKDADVYANYDKVEMVTDDLHNIAKKTVGDAQDEIYSAFNALNSVNGFKDYVGAINVEKYDTVFQAISETIDDLADKIEGKADDIKAYEESPWYAKVGSTLTMGLIKPVEGILSVFDHIGDAAVSVVGWGAGLFGAKGFQEDCANFIKKEWSHDIFNFYYDSSFGKASLFTEDSAIAGGLKLVGKVPTLLTVGLYTGAAGIFAEGMGKGVESGLQAGQTYNQAMWNGIKTGGLQTLATALGVGIPSVTPGLAVAAGQIVGDVVANGPKRNQPSTIENEFDKQKPEMIATVPPATVMPTVPPTAVPPTAAPPTTTQPTTAQPTTAQPTTAQPTGGGGQQYPTVAPPTQPTIPSTKPTVPPTIQPTVPPTVKPTVPPTIQPTVPPTIQPTVPPTVRPTVPPTQPTIPPTQPRPTAPPTTSGPGPEPTVPPTKSGWEYDGDEFISDELENADALSELDDLASATSIDEIVKGSKYSKIPTSSKPVPVTKSGSSSVIPIAAGLTAAAAAGIGAKAYMDYKRNNEDEDEEYDEEYEDDDFGAEEWSGDEETVNIENTDQDEDLIEYSNNDYYQEEDSGYTARDNASELDF